MTLPGDPTGSESQSCHGRTGPGSARPGAPSHDGSHPSTGQRRTRRSWGRFAGAEGRLCHGAPRGTLAASVLAYNKDMSGLAHSVPARPDIGDGLAAPPRIRSRLGAVPRRRQEAPALPASRSRGLRLAALVLVFGGGLSFHGRAQVTAGAPGTHSPEPSPATEVVQASRPRAVPLPSPATVAGTVLDAGGAAVPGARVTLIAPGDTVPRVATTDSHGAFTLTGLPPGTYQVKVSVAGSEPVAAAPVVLGPGEQHDLPIVVVRLATKQTTVYVHATLNDVAQAQVQEQEQQRILGFLPNYYTSYLWNAAPMTTKLKFQLALRTATDPFTFVVVAGVAGVEQAHKTFPGYGQGAEGYAKRYGASYADTVAGRMFSSAILPAVLHQDPRYFYQGSGSTRSRLLYALVSTVLCRGDNGRLEPNYSHVLGSFAAAGFSNLYRAPQDRQASLTLRNGLIITGSGAVVNLLREFLSRKLTSSVPTFANGKP